MGSAVNDSPPQFRTKVIFQHGVRKTLVAAVLQRRHESHSGKIHTELALEGGAVQDF